MDLRWPIIAHVLLTVVSVGLFATGGHFAASALIESQRARQLDDLVQLALRRSEAAVAYGASALGELGQQGNVNCNAISLQAVRFHVYQRGPIKDIRVANHNGTIRCSAYSETLEFDKAWPERAEMLPSTDGTLRLFRVDQFFGVALGVLYDISAETSLIAILAFNTSLLDVMPAELREDSEVGVELNDGRPIALLKDAEPTIHRPKIVRVVATSERFPLRSFIEVNALAFAGWNREAYAPILVLSAVLGLAFGVLLGRAAARPDSPVAALDRAIAAQEFRPYLQPVFELSTGRIIGCEMLARWVRADGSVIPPVRFIGLAEDSGRIETMTWQMLNEALTQLRPLLQRDKLFKLSLNISPRHFTAPGFIDELRRSVSAARVSHRQITVELTERESFADLEKAAALVAELQSFGFQVAIDDVGIGNSGLSHLQRLGANVLKVDKFFVDSINRDPTALSIVEMLVRLGGKLGMDIVAEGVEDRDQIAALLKCGVQAGQGYVVSPPLSVRDFLDFLSLAQAQVTPFEAASSNVA